MNFQDRMLNNHNRLLKIRTRIKSSRKAKQDVQLPRNLADWSKQAERLEAKINNVKKAYELLDKEKFQDNGKEQEPKISIIAIVAT